MKEDVYWPQPTRGSRPPKQCPYPLCPWCGEKMEADNGNMFTFEHPADPNRSASVSFYNGTLAIEINQPGDEKTQRLSCKINHCPFYGRAYGEEET